MRVERDWLRRLVFEIDDGRRFTQDSPILPEVWLKGGIEYCRSADARVDLLLTPHKRHTASVLGREVLARLTENSARADNGQPGRAGHAPKRVLSRPTWTVSVNQTTVAVSVTLEELITCVLPLSEWWLRNIKDVPGADTRSAEDKVKILPPAATQERARREWNWLAMMAGVLVLCARESVDEDKPEKLKPGDSWVNTVLTLGRDPFDGEQSVEHLDRQFEGATNREYRRFQEIAHDKRGQIEAFEALADRALAIEAAVGGAGPPVTCLWSVGLNRPGFVAIDRSVAATKADAALRVFEIRCADLAWAVIDSGIDAAHPAFLGAPDVLTPGGDPRSRIVKSYDFTRLRQLVSLDSHPSTGPNAMQGEVDLEEADRQFKRMRERLRSGQSLDWGTLEPLIDISYTTPTYRPPVHDHGTHVAGIIAAAGNGTPYVGMCPDIRLFDLRVLNDSGRGEEFSIVAALQFIRYLNARSDQPVIHGVNLSLSLLHDVENFACGRTPICDECDRLVASGVVVVAAAGNRGYERVLSTKGELEAYRAISITDPGNAESVLTVGSTHRFQPHTYGVSYFSSRGPTGDGRVKPDVLAPGERIYSTLLENTYGAKDGTSMAAPHVSGVAALLMARHREFIGQPARVKKIICETATDLGRERYFQGYGMVDALRALQRA